MLFTGFTPIHEMDGILVKREDLAFWSSLDYPSGSKVRQYSHMIKNTDGKIPPLLVGCSANSCQQIYIAAAAHLNGLKGIIYVPKRAVRTSATNYCDELGSEINEIRPGYLSKIRKEASQRAIDLKKITQWDRELAITDAAEQCENIPEGVKRVIVPTGSGLTAAGVLIGVAGKGIEVVAVATSPMIIGSGIRNLAYRYLKDKTKDFGKLTFIPPMMKYDKHVILQMPDETPLDPFYAAKAWHLAKEGDLFWPPGLRPIRSMPVDCQNAFSYWKGPI